MGTTLETRFIHVLPEASKEKAHIGDFSQILMKTEWGTEFKSPEKMRE